ncbi:hypothetical protein CHUAL_013125 [Chamberlinius hualienensis]
MVIMDPDRLKANGETEKKSGKRSSVNKTSDEYKKKRERNNLAVKKSRTKTKMKTQETLERVNKLRAENELLESKIKLLSKELSFLRDLFVAHARAHSPPAIEGFDPSIFDIKTEPSTNEETKTLSAEPDQNYIVKVIVDNSVTS